jgi:hypothetical protein
MNDLQRSVKSRIDLPDSSAKFRLSKQSGRKAAIYGVALLTVLVMAAWFGFLGWGIVAMLQWLLECTKNLWTMHF